MHHRQKKPDCFTVFIEFFRYTLFFCFAVLSFRILFVTFLYIESSGAAFIGAILLLVVIFTINRPEWTIYCFVISIPLVSGLQLSGIATKLPVLSAIFAAVYLTWFFKNLVKKDAILPMTPVGHLIDILSAIVLISITVQLIICLKAGLTFYELWSYPVTESRNDLLFGIVESYIVLQGFFFYRMVTLTLTREKFDVRLLQTLSLQTFIIICFSVLQLTAKIPQKEHDLLFSPFDDIHSYGSYIALLFFVYLATGLTSKQKYNLKKLFAVFILIFIFLSSSFAAIGATFIVGCYYLIAQFKLGNIISVCVLFLTFSGLFYLQFNPDVLDSFNSSDNRTVRRYARRLDIHRIGRVLKGRMELTDQALGIIREFPLTGSGVGSFYRIARHYHISGTPHPERIKNAHNYYLQFCADLGIPALLIFLIVIFKTLRMGIVTSRSKSASGHLARGLLFGLSAYLITMLTGHPLLLSNQQFLFWYAIAAITVLYLPSATNRMPYRTETEKQR